jgi:hypothetical protein
MTTETLKKATRLNEFITTTEYSLNEINRWLDKIQKSIKREQDSDGQYNLCIAEYDDGSGDSTSIARDMGNVEVLMAIRDVLDSQLKRFRKELESL